MIGVCMCACVRVWGRGAQSCAHKRSRMSSGMGEGARSLHNDSERLLRVRVGLFYSVMSFLALHVGCMGSLSFFGQY